MLFSTYNCVLASVYNYLKQIHGLNPSIEAICLQPSMLLLHGVDGFVSISSPLSLAETYLDGIGAAIEFPAFDGIDEALAYASAHLASSGGLPFSINLRYDVLEPLPFDNDLWHFHWMAGREDDGSYRMFDMYENEYYRMERSRLRLAIDTPFNYRDDGKFKPFMVVRAPDLDAARMKMESGADFGRQLRNTASAYPLDVNREVWNNGLAFLRRFIREKPDPGSMYRAMNFAQILTRCRSVIWDSLRERGLSDLPEVRLWRERWLLYRSVLGIALSRRTDEEFDRLEASFGPLIDLEYEALNAASRTAAGSGRCREGRGA
ncbi:hypothetical protein ACF3MZ_04925 [Paenibacillaceae bacterium WGS1546]|uniref:hypothetical protein n=1 Tax=Cohnella sp. WGS1546 TaxID=3366810 RepID=UPI00372D8375